MKKLLLFFCFALSFLNPFQKAFGTFDWGGEIGYYRAFPEYNPEMLLSLFLGAKGENLGFHIFGKFSRSTRMAGAGGEIVYDWGKGYRIRPRSRFQLSYDSVTNNGSKKTEGIAAEIWQGVGLNIYNENKKVGETVFLGLGGGLVHPTFTNGSIAYFLVVTIGVSASSGPSSWLAL